MQRCLALVHVVGVLALAACAQEPQACKIVEVTRVNFVQDSLLQNRFFIPVTIDGQKKSLLVDTGAEATMIERAALGAQEVDGLGGRMVNVTGASTAFWHGEVKSMQIGGMTGPIHVDVVPDAKSDTSVGVAGSLGLDEMASYDLDFDIAGGDLGFYRTIGDCDGVAHAAMAGSLYSVPEWGYRVWRHRSLMVPVTVGDKTIAAQIDTGATVTLMSVSIANAAGITDAMLAKDPLVSVDAAGLSHIVARRQVIRQISIGDLDLHDMPVLVVAASNAGGQFMVSGADFVRTVHLWLSNSSHTVVMQYPPTPTPTAGE